MIVKLNKPDEPMQVFHKVKGVTMHGNWLILTWNPGNSKGYDISKLETFDIKATDSEYEFNEDEMHDIVRAKTSMEELVDVRNNSYLVSKDQDEAVNRIGRRADELVLDYLEVKESE